MVTAEQFRAQALGLPGAAEAPHFEAASFRVPGVKGRIFATLLPDGDHARVFLAEEVSRAVALQWPDCCSEVWWGKRLSGVQLALALATSEIVEELLQDGWRRRAPNRLLQEHDGAPGI